MPRWKNALQTDQEVHRLKREAVLREAGKAFGKKGYHNTSLDGVAKALHVSKGTLYNYVKDKQEILFECHTIALDIGDRALSYGSTNGVNGADVLRKTLARYIELLTEELGACAVLMEVDAMRPDDRKIAVSRRNSFEKAFVQIIERGIGDGSIRQIDPKLAVFTFMGAINWLPRWFNPAGRLNGLEIANSVTDMLLSGLIIHEGTAAVERPALSATAVTAPARKARTG